MHCYTVIAYCHFKPGNVSLLLHDPTLHCVFLRVSQERANMRSVAFDGRYVMSKDVVPTQGRGRGGMRVRICRFAVAKSTNRERYGLGAMEKGRK